jgi:hypothetical protein
MGMAMAKTILWVTTKGRESEEAVMGAEMVRKEKEKRRELTEVDLVNECPAFPLSRP